MPNTKLKTIRERHNLSQTQMGEILHLSQSAYQKLENGSSSLRSEQIVILIKQFGEGAKDLLEGDGIEITFKDNAVNNGTINGKAQIENFNNTSSDVLNKILEEINNLKIRLNP
jgi:transcriptional regulator with XRE-family HTH domain